MESLLMSKLQRDHLMNLALIRHLEVYEDQVSLEITKLVSHVLNIHHIFNCRFAATKPESDEWDMLPNSWFEKLQVENYRTTLSLLEQSETDLEKRFNFLFSVLEHNTYHRAQIIMKLKQDGIPLPNLTLLVLEE
ncbi:MAG: hypothetical protein LW688_08890 [Cryomorphaceae bacterium]|jgi:uncharacterized damage-inducible protein DinB|nr:hypothetical protein [Cryomorphaceae bacterium]